MPSKKIKRDENGCPIIPGGKTYGEMIKPKGGRASRGNELKEKSDNRLIALMEIGQKAKKLFRIRKANYKNEEVLEFQNKLARSPKVVQFAYHKSRRDKLLKELKELDKGNALKQRVMRGITEKEIQEIEKHLEELYQEIKMENEL